MKILIIGGTGLISKYLTAQLASSAHEVTILNRRETDLPVPDGIKVIRADRTDYAAFEQTVSKLGRFDVVVDMVGYQPEDGHSLVRAFGDKTDQLIFCSTVDVYRKFPDSYPIGPYAAQYGLGDYAAKKVEIEATLQDAASKKRFNLTVIRPAFTYGEGRGFLSTYWAGGYIDRLRKGKPIIQHGDGTNLWTSCHASDVACAFFGALGNSVSFGKSYNVNGDEWMPWDQAHRIIAQAANAPEPSIVHIPSDLLAKISPNRAQVLLDNFQYTNIFDNQSAHQDLGFKCTIRFAEGAKRVIAWLDSHDQIGNSDEDNAYDSVVTKWKELSEAMIWSLA